MAVRWRARTLPRRDAEAVVIGDDRARIESAVEPQLLAATRDDDGIYADGGASSVADESAPGHTPSVGGMGELYPERGRVACYRGGRVTDSEDVDRLLEEREVDHAALAFGDVDREWFFGTLRSCRDHDVEAVVPVDHESKVLTNGTDEGRDAWVTVDYAPFSRWQRTLKRLFDVAFATVGLAALAPLIAVIALAIKADSSGPVLYTQPRTGRLGATFQLRKFRTMYTGSENATPETDGENDRITPVGRVLRRTHMDEIPQLWSILRGDMSTVGPRAAWVEEERLLEREVEEWPKRWFVKPGLTGLAQINGASSTAPADKLRYDLEYVDRQSFLLDVWIVAVQIRTVLFELIELLSARIRRSP